MGYDAPRPHFSLAEAYMKTYLLALLCLFPAIALAADAPLHLNARTRVPVPGTDLYEVRERSIDWPAKETAIIICDLWDQHWCKGATQRVGEMAPRINQLANALRSQGGLIVHAPSDTMKNYVDHPARKLALAAPHVEPPVTLKGWRSLDLQCEGKFPIDDSDGGCDDEPRCKNFIAWKGEHPAVKIETGDIISESGEEIYNVFQQRGIKHILYVGVHANMCVLGRSFGIRRMTAAGLDCALVRDLTDTMYNHKMAPFVPHARGTDLVVRHIETYWCKSIDSSDILGDPKPKQVVIAIDEPEYNAKETLPEFAKTELEGKLGLKVTILQGDKIDSLPNTEAIGQADLLILFMRRTTLPEEQLGRFKAHFDSGKPVIGIRTACHAFQNYLAFDPDVLGGNYHNHFGNKTGTELTLAEGASANPLLRGVTSTMHSAGSLYKTSPLAKTATPLLLGKAEGTDTEPVAWTNTHQGGKIFFTSLGHPDDFKNPSFRRLLTNAVLYTLEKPIPQD
jgi:type 1 glutamine amidotransferase/nicotinamidase-related amidase